ncbi:MAG: hypothetical protein II821_07595 [Treponema sp.]|nr:hypothetical protein [Treponema sp.]
MEILTKEWNAYIDSMKKAISEEESWQKELDGCLEMAEAAKNGDEGALLDLIACKTEAGIDFEESVEFLNKKADEGDIFALKTLGFLNCVGVFNPFDKSKSSLVEINTDESDQKAAGYFKRACDLGSVHAMVWFAMRDCIHAASWSGFPEENTEPAPGAEDFFKAEKSALKAIEESKKPGCDCTPNAISIVYYWLSSVYASKNPVNPVYDEEKARYWKECYEKLTH